MKHAEKGVLKDTSTEYLLIIPTAGGPMAMPVPFMNIEEIPVPLRKFIILSAIHDGGRTRVDEDVAHWGIIGPFTLEECEQTVRQISAMQIESVDQMIGIISRHIENARQLRGHDSPN